MTRRFLRLVGPLVIAAALATTGATTATAAPRAEPTPAVKNMTIAYTTTTLSPAKITEVSSTSASLGATVACTDRSKRTSAYNVLGQLLMYYMIAAHWCWDRNLIITSGSNTPYQDTPGLCWKFDGNGSYGQSGGRGYGYWDITRQGKFSCGFSSFAQHRTLTVAMTVRGGGGAN